MHEIETGLSAEDIPDNSSVAVSLQGTDVLICKSNGEIVAVENRCSHQNKPLAGGRIRNGFLFCPVHGMRFRLSNGEAIGQLTSEPINVIETMVEQGSIRVRLPQKD